LEVAFFLAAFFFASIFFISMNPIFFFIASSPCVIRGEHVACPL
jgi:hypothetical protein